MQIFVKVQRDDPLPNPWETHVFNEWRVFLAHFLSEKGIINKISIIEKILISQKQEYVRSFLGLIGYYRIFIKDFSRISSPLFSLLTNGLDFCWIALLQKEF